MNLSLLRSEVWEHIGRPDDLDPSSDTQYEGKPLLNWVVNEGLIEVAFWVDPKNGAMLKPEKLYGEMFFQTKVVTGTLDANAPANNQIIFPSADVGSENDRYVGWVVQVGSESKMIMQYVGSTRTATLHEDWTTNPASGDSYTLSKNYMRLLPSNHAWVSDHIQLPSETDLYRSDGNLLHPLKITDLPDDGELDRATESESYPRIINSWGDPTEWYDNGARIYLNRVPSSQRWYKMEYLRYPSELTADTDAPEIPVQFHFGIVLWGRWWGYMRHQSSPDAYSAEKTLESFMRRTMNHRHFEGFRVPDHGSLQLEEE